MDKRHIFILIYLFTFNLLIKVCIVGQCSIPSLIPNSNFESNNNCPNASGQITFANSWLETSNFPAEYYNCSFSNISSTYEAPPTPNSGTGYIGLSNQSTGNKQYASVCLSSGLTAGSSYIYQFDITAANGSSSSLFSGSTSNLSYTMVLYGNSSCISSPYNSNSCPSPSDGWQVLATITITTSATEWTTHSVEFIPTSNIQSIAIGSDCNTAPNNVGLCSGGLCYNYYYIDNLILNLTDLYPTVNTGIDVTNNCTTPTNNLNASISGGTPNFNYAWSPSSGLNDSTIQSPIANPTVSTDYIVTITDANGCKDKDTISVTVDKAPPIANAGADQTINCNTPSVNLSASGGSLYSWTPSNGLDNTNSSSVISTTTSTTNYIVTVTSDNGCVSTDTVLVTVDKDIPNVTASPNTSIDCSTPDAQLYATGGVSYKWTPNFALNNPNISSPIARPPTNTTYIVTVTSANGCEATDSTVVTVINPTPLPRAGSDIKLCGTYNTTLNPNLSTQLSIDTYLWTTSNNNPSNILFSDNTDPNTSISNLQEGVYKLYFNIDNNICPPVMDSLLVYVYDPPYSNAGLDDSLCNTYSTYLNANTPQGTSTGKWSLQTNFPNPNPGGVVFSDENSPTSSISGLSEGVYRLIWTVKNGNCTPARDTVQISVFNNPIADAGTNDSLCNIYSTNLAAIPAAGTSIGTWTQLTSSNPSSITFSNENSPFSNINTLIEGTYSFVWTVRNGNCNEDIDTVNISVFDSPQANAGSNLSICAEDSLNLDTLLFLNATNPNGTSFGNWSISEHFNNPSTPIFINNSIYNTEVTNLLEGEYMFIWTVDNGNCPSDYDSIKVLTFDKPIAHVGNNQELCATYSTNLYATPTIGLSYGQWSIPTNWNNPSVVNIDDTTEHNSLVSNLIEGTYKFVWTVGNGNCTPETDTLTVTIYDQPIANAGVNIELCNTYSIHLDAINPIGTSYGTWSQDLNYNNNSIINFDDDTLYNSNSTNYIEGTYRLIWTVNNGVCNNDKDSILISIYDTPVANAGFDQYICDSDTVVFNGQGNIGTSTGEWKLDPNFSYPSIPIFRDSSNNNTKADNFIVGDYQALWIVSNGVCPSDTDTVVIHNMRKPVAIANYEKQQCDNKCFKVTSLSTSPQGDGVLMHWIINNKDYYDSISEICISEANDYDVRLIVTASNSCVDSIVGYPPITINPSPNADFELLHETDSLIELQRLDIENMSSGDAILFEYHMGNGDTLKEADFIYFYKNFGNYEITQLIENQYGCRDSITKTKEVKKRRTAFVPNTFTPNGDGINDVFIPVLRGIEETSYEFTIFNRWGTMIFKTDSPNIGWNGKYKGKVVKDDAYIWKLKYTPENSSETTEKQGHVILYKFTRK